MESPSFARDKATLLYYEKRAREYDDWYDGTGQFARRDRPGWGAEVDRLVEFIDGLPAARTLDIACGSGYLTRHLHGVVVGIDQSRAMVAIAQARLPRGVAMVGDALDLPFSDGAFDRVFTGHFYGHLSPGERAALFGEVRRVGGELVVVDAAVRPGVDVEQWQRRVLDDGSRHRIYKRYFTAAQLAAEIGGEILFDGDWFVAARAD